MEHLVEFMVWAFTLIGITVTITQSTLLYPARSWVARINPFLGTLFSCGMCFSFWASMILSFFMNSLTDCVFLDGFLGVGLWSYVVSRSPKNAA